MRNPRVRVGFNGVKRESEKKTEIGTIRKLNARRAPQRDFIAADKGLAFTSWEKVNGGSGGFGHGYR